MTELRTQFAGAFLVVLTVAAVICAAINFQQNKKYPLADDGVTWMDEVQPGASAGSNSRPRTRVVAAHVQSPSPGERAGIKQGDVLLKVGNAPVAQATDIAQVHFRLGAWASADYVLERGGVEVKTKVIIGEAPRDLGLFYQYAVGAAYLFIGLFLYFRRSRAPKSFHFYAICLASFVLHSFHYTGKLNDFDIVIYIGNVIAGLLAPAMFLHFCLTFPEPAPGWRKSQITGIYLPALALMALQFGLMLGVVRTAIPPLEMRWLLDRAWLVLFSACYLAGAFLLHLRFGKADDPIVRQQLKWLRNGTLLGAVPFSFFYALPFAIGSVPPPSARVAVLTLAFLPLTWAYAILRYRLMDVDIIFQQGYVYLVATLSVLGIIFSVLFALPGKENLSPLAVGFLVLIGVFVFEPLRNWLQQQMDRYIFYKDRYDYRNTLIAFARELTSEMDLDRTLDAVGERLVHTLSLSHVAFFLSSDDGKFYLHTAVDKSGPRHDILGEKLDLGFLSTEASRPHLFFERTRHTMDVVTQRMPAAQRAAIGRLDLTYYLPCTFRGRTTAWLGASRTDKGDFLPSDDVDLLKSIAGYLAMAVENTRLYRSLADKAQQYERLKEFSENIVESINVGILAADLDDRVESWNSQIERLTGIPRHAAVGRRLDELFPPELAAEFERFRGDGQVHQLYKFPLKKGALLSATAMAGATGMRNGNGHAEANGNSHGTQTAVGEAVVNIAIAPLVAKDNEQIGRLVIFDDVTEREDLERRLVQADKLSSIGLLAAGVAHEVNTPLAVISTYAQMLAKQVAGDDQKTKLLDRIAKQTFRASEIVNSLLNFSRTGSTEFEEVDLNRVARETITLLEHQLNKARIEVVCELTEPLPPIKGNTGKLQQVFLNLLLNARDAMENGGGRLTVRTRISGEAVRAEVSDTGHGMPREILDRIFDPFFTTKVAKKGTGLGLSVTYGIVEEHGGHIEVDSKPGQGTLFRVEFPAVRKPVHA